MSTLRRAAFITGSSRALPCLAALLLLAVPLLTARPAATSSFEAANTFTLYAAPNGEPFVPLDPETLADRADADPLDIGGSLPSWILSADGSTSAHSLPDGAIVVRAGVFGPERRRIDPAEPVFAQALSRDGARLLTQVPMMCGPSGCTAPVWYVYDTTDGRVVATVRGDDKGYGGEALLDPTGRRLYRPTFARDGRTEGPWPLELVAYDLTDSAGPEIARLTLSTVPAGVWFARSIDQIPVEEVLLPAIALSPDGSTIAVVHADTDALTLIDAATFQVERSVSLVRPTSATRRALEWLGLIPQAAAAKFLAGRRLDAVFAPDGGLLYVFGVEGTVGASARDATGHGLGLRAIDPSTGVVVGRALGEQELSDVLFAPDGHTLYVNGPTVSWIAAAGEPSYRLSRLDPRTLNVLVARDFPSRRWVILVPES